MLPDYFRYMHEPQNNNIVHKLPDGRPNKMLQVISKASGWITVTPRRKDRKHPIEKQTLGDVKKVNVLSPVWMQVEHKAPDSDPMIPTSVKHGVRHETNRTFLVEKKQPRRSIFALGTMRHNVPTKAEADKYQ